MQISNRAQKPSVAATPNTPPRELPVSSPKAQARQATVQAATDLYGANSAELKKVQESWTAVGVN
jgi:Zn-dependent metalloprotease